MKREGFRMDRLSDTAKAMLEHRHLEADRLNAERLAPLCGYASFRAGFALSGLLDFIPPPAIFHAV
jgi:hypothetical protein